MLDKLQAGDKSAYDVAEELIEETDAFPTHVFFILEKFEKARLFMEAYEAEDVK